MVPGATPPVPPEDLFSFDCSGILPPEVIKGLEYFNAGKYFEAHEELETAWRREKGPIRELYRGVLQVGVAYYHIQRRNYNAALKMFSHCRQWLDPFPAECCGIDLARLRQDFERVEARLQQLDPSDRVTFSFQPIHYRISIDG